jgi:hypothetical protein
MSETSADKLTGQRLHLRVGWQDDRTGDMESTEISDIRSLGDWLSGKPANWGQVIAARAALRCLPYIAHSGDSWLNAFSILPFHALITSWTQLADIASFTRGDENRANSQFGGASFDFKFYKSQGIAASAADASYHSADLQSKSIHWISDCTKAVGAAESSFRTDIKQKFGPSYDESIAIVTFWKSVSDDCRWLFNSKNQETTEKLIFLPLWFQSFPYWQQNLFPKLERKLISIDPQFAVWIDWYQRRFVGERAAFDIPGDKDRKEDKAILGRLIEASNADFWSKGYQHVNAQLTHWLDEARKRAKKNFPPLVAEAHGVLELTGSGTIELGPVPIPPQQSGAIAYGVNKQSKLDRLALREQKHLLDNADQRRAYRDIRQAACDLRNEGQRLGPRLTPALARFIRSFPARFESAETYLVWRDGNALRRIYLAHQRVAKSRDPDEAKLEAVVAEGLGGLLDLFNPFAFADDGIREKDQQRIALQERVEAESESAAAAPLLEAIQASPHVATDNVRDDIAAIQEGASLPADDPYAAQVLTQSNLTAANIVAGIIDGARKFASNSKRIGFHMARGAAAATGAAIATGAFAIAKANGIPLLEFVSTNASVLKEYVGIAFGSYPHLPDVIEQIKQVWLATKAKL